jgi:hypothetical protein
MHYNSCYRIIGQKLQNSRAISSIVNFKLQACIYLYIFIYMSITELCTAATINLPNF